MREHGKGGRKGRIVYLLLLLRGWAGSSLRLPKRLLRWGMSHTHVFLFLCFLVGVDFFCGTCGRKGVGKHFQAAASTVQGHAF